MCQAILFFLVLATILIKVDLTCTAHAIGIVSEETLVEGYILLTDFDHGEQYNPQISTSETSTSKTTVASLSKRFYLLDKKSAEATCINSQFPSFQGQPFYCENQISNVFYEQSAVEMFELQTAEEAFSVALHDMSDAMASSHRSDIRPWCKVPAMDSGAKYIRCALAGDLSKVILSGSNHGISLLTTVPRRRERNRGQKSAKGNKTPHGTPRGNQPQPQGPMMPMHPMSGAPMGPPGQMSATMPMMNWGMQPCNRCI